ncbi:hypothetical protein [Xenorhabdus hominickii]|uniref:Uncharacterized protein n=1 Tax=Xenorhabdus hominickii TaxID=351679 RepID=A0A2G0Q8P5_XENHO|nr:hypothetical protein [Xenorhabdus hominickii]AOM41173.1 hypothetical protein A9255_11625 [Xenorhabdus hominickii]PHM55586.1 hypothetical protein Xhom_02332 [Xenorhabdus hominickii]PHM57050.1 hypothetical protein Xhom_00004 [Xenorhabdus hominickii]
MNQFEYYYQWKIDDLMKLEEAVSEESSHLNDTLSGRDPDVERLNEEIYLEIVNDVKEEYGINFI